MKNFIPFKSIIVLALVLLAVACHKKTPVNPPTNQVPAAESAPAPGPPACNLTADPATLAQGRSVTLSWTSKDATDVRIDPGLDKQLAEGSATVTPQGSTTYILTATGPGGSTSCTARVTVTAAAQSPSVSEENLPGGAASLAAELQDIFFDYDAADLRPDAQTTLTADAAALKAHGDAKVTVEGHCDQRGSEEYNLGLGQRRADAAKNFLVTLGVAEDRINTISYGKDRLSCTEDDESCWAKNRRDHFVLK
ncbi:MAG TPA: peptidoglycan-associated lipoprotein Pal [Terriglobia bacterium]|nr:peptidoglycan-associated lipoprotein Pal [Terriglobia bacterium]